MRATVQIGDDTTPPTVTINQAAGQADPTSTSPVNFTVVFSEAVSDFATGDVTLSGTAGATTATVTGSGTTYNVAVSNMTGSGTVIASIAAGVAHDAANNANTASTSTDNTITYNGGGSTETFGLDSGNDVYTSSSVELSLQKFRNTVGDGIVTKLELSLDDVPYSPTNCKMAIYTDDGSGHPDQLLGLYTVNNISDGWVSSSDLSGQNIQVSEDAYYTGWAFVCLLTAMSIYIIVTALTPWLMTAPGVMAIAGRRISPEMILITIMPLLSCVLPFN
jgi:hypothetical protein